ncbi:MAG: arsenate reductase ArsC [Chthonomonadales bacterium]
MKTVLFVCVHNAGRSQMAEAYLRQIAKVENVDVESLSAGTVPGTQVNPIAMEVMKEEGIDLTTHTPKVLTQEMADHSDKVITMGCGVDAAACPARIHLSEDWGLDDPAGRPLDEVRRIRDEIKVRVHQLVNELKAAEA